MRNVAQIISLSTVVEKGHVLKGDDADEVTICAKHFHDCLKTFMNTSGAAYDWSPELDAIVQQWTKLVLGYKDTVPGATMKYHDLNSALPDILKGLPEIIEV